MKPIENDAFLSQLHKCFEQSKKSGTVYLTMKRYTDRRKKQADGDQVMANGEATANEDDDKRYPCLVRAQYKKTAICTVVEPGVSDSFQTSYTNIIHAHMDAMKKKDRSKLKAEKKLAAAKKQKVEKAS